MNKRFAVMDLGTNTFHLLICKAGPDGPVEVYHGEEAVKLGEGGINKGYIVETAFARGLACMERFSGVIQQNNAGSVRAIATSALRNAANGGEFIEKVKAGTGIEIEIIDGDQEAAFIYKGVRASGCLAEDNSLIVDIGGGSVEFIICNNHEIYWKQSFEIGAARLMDRFHRTDPIPPDFIIALSRYLEDCLMVLFNALKQHPVTRLIGSSGVFESYAGIIEKGNGNAFDLKKAGYYTFNTSALLGLIEKIILSTHQQRAGETGIINVRVDMIVTASILTRFLVNKIAVKEVLMCTNSLKEGVLAEMISETAFGRDA
jgi:exopolyphosphatase/guanosine-5'-triphosphate,3'-diphosphate pyrophosphatase